jgi:hypothetical protein
MRFTLRRFAWPLVAGAIMNVVVAWICAAYSPWLTYVGPKDPEWPADPEQIVGPDGTRGWWHITRGVGWLEYAGQMWRGADGHFFCWSGVSAPPIVREAGFPFRSVRSVVSAIDSDFDPAAQSPKRVRWQLPVRGVISRGVNTSDLPLWTRVIENRRIPLVPMFWGFTANSIVYACLCLAMLKLLKKLARNPLERRRGFEVLPRQATGTR